MSIRNILIGLVIFIFGVATDLSAQSKARFAVIGDYGSAGQAELDVSNIVKSWNLDIIITVGDNNYENGADSTIDKNIGQYYHEFIYPYVGTYGEGDTINRFFPALGNHDWRAPGASPYLAYFTLPGYERYYDFVKGPVHFFVIDSDANEPDGRTSTSAQALWLRDRLLSSRERWKVVYFHHPPYTSGTTHGPTYTMQWPFDDWGVTAVMSGHEHLYERIIQNNVLYFVNGLGGKGLHPLGTASPGSQVRYNSDYGAMLVEASDDSMNFKFINRVGSVIDNYTITPARFTLDLKAKWNILSLPAKVVDSKKATLFPTAASEAYAYSSSGYEQKNTLANGVGYWLKFNSDQLVAIVGTSVLRDTVYVQPGWNLIGSISNPLPVSAVVEIPAGNVGSQYFEYNGSYTPSDSLLPGRGYWVKVNQEGKLVLSSTPP